MTWHTVTVLAEELRLFVFAIHHSGGTITSSRPSPGGVSVTYVTTGDRDAAPLVGDRSSTAASATRAVLPASLARH
jgi:hypothetical protein